MSMTQITLGESGGGGAYKGTFSTSSSNPTATVTVPFEISKLFVYSTAQSNSITVIYNKEVATSKQAQMYSANGTYGFNGDRTMPDANGTNIISSIQGNQFTYKSDSGWHGDYEFVAIP